MARSSRRTYNRAMGKADILAERIRSSLGNGSAAAKEAQRNRAAKKLGWGLKLTHAQVLEIRNQHASGVSMKQLAARFGVTKSTICEIVNGRTWRLPEAGWRP